MDELVCDKETCRLCGGMHDRNNMICLFPETGVGQCILERIRKYTPFKVNIDDCVPKFVCTICTSHIDHWHNFLQLCLKAQKNIISPVKQNQDIAETIREKVTAPTVDDGFSTVTRPTIYVTYNNASKQKKVQSPSKHHKVLRSVISGVPENLKTCSIPDSTVGESVSIADVPVKKAITFTSARGNYCIARWCNNNTKSNPSLSLFRVPKNRNRAAKWLENAERDDLLHLDLNILYSKFLCIKHFTDDMFTNSTKRRLVWNAVPTLFPKPRFAEKMKQVQTDAAVQKMALELLHSSVPTRIMPKPYNKSTSSMQPSAKVATTTGMCDIEEKPMDVVEPELDGPENSSICELLEELPLKTAHNTAKSDSENNVVVAYTQPQSTFLTDSICSFQESHEPVFPCRYCGEMFLVKSSLILHQTTYHPENSVGCEQCGKVNYSSKSEFMGHLCDHAEVTSIDT